MEFPTKSATLNILLAPILIPIILVLLVIAVPFFILWFLKGLWLNYRFRARWGIEGKNILFIHSESPIWQEHIENSIIPSIEKKAVFLNWSKRSEWGKRKPLEAKVLSHWGGDSEFNPMAIIFTPNGKIKTIRFYQAFKDFKHGKDKLLKEKESELYGYL